MALREDSDPVDLAISPAVVSVLIELARQYDLSGADVDEDGEDIDVEDAEEAGHGATADGHDATAEELREAIADLNEDEVVDLIALAWVGRGDFDRESWQEARALAGERHRTHSADYLMGMPTLGDFLEEGLAALGHAFEPP